MMLGWCQNGKMVRPAAERCHVMAENSSRSPVYHPEISPQYFRVFCYQLHGS